ncbi:hypothetical protein PTMSG1_00033 [Pyrenophora teres f. maculata]|nr:hypothetical protein PTMSG1_00033 [Pyrenophora teres f. maculata]
MATNRTKAKTKTKRNQRGRPFRPANRHASKNKKRKDPRTGPRPIRGPNGIKLKQQQYYKFTSDIRIYHYSAPYLSLHTFKTLLQRRAHGYVAALVGSDEALSRNMLTTPTDVIPPGALEVGYLPSVFAHGGSALGFRLGNRVVEWLCFDRDIKESVLDKLDINTETQEMLFDHVADLEKPVPVSSTSRKVPYTEHKDWYESLREAGWRPCVVRLSWRNFGWDIKDEILRRRRRALEEERDRGVGGEHGDGDGDDEGGWEDQDSDEEVFEGRHGRETGSPETIGRGGSVAYCNPVTPALESAPDSSNPMLSGRNSNTPPPQMQSY